VIPTPHQTAARPPLPVLVLVDVLVLVLVLDEIVLVPVA
jgi:hypothetical protein